MINKKQCRDTVGATSSLLIKVQFGEHAPVEKRELENGDVDHPPPTQKPWNTHMLASVQCK